MGIESKFDKNPIVCYTFGYVTFLGRSCFEQSMRYRRQFAVGILGNTNGYFMIRKNVRRLAVFSGAFAIFISSTGALPFNWGNDKEKEAEKVNFDIPEFNYEAFSLDGGAAAITEKETSYEVAKAVAEAQEAEEKARLEAEKAAEEEARARAITYVMANVQNSVNVRKEPNTECEVVGLLYRGCGGDVLEKGDGWTKIKSGDLEGWISNDFLLFGLEAQAFAEENCQKIARVNVECLRIRKGPSLDSETDGLFEINSEWTVIEELGEWVKVDYKGKERYVSAEYVDIEVFIESGETVEEIKAREAIAAMEKAKLTANQGAYSASADDTTLLGALIQAEAGNQPYDGQLAVGAVVLNRVKSPKYPNSIREVIYAPGQFGPASNGSLETILANGVKEDCMQAAREALEGATTVGDAKNFHRAGNGESGIIIGAHVFY